MGRTGVRSFRNRVRPVHFHHQNAVAGEGVGDGCRSGSTRIEDRMGGTDPSRYVRIQSAGAEDSSLYASRAFLHSGSQTYVGKKTPRPADAERGGVGLNGDSAG